MFFQVQNCSEALQSVVVSFHPRRYDSAESIHLLFLSEYVFMVKKTCVPYYFLSGKRRKTLNHKPICNI